MRLVTASEMKEMDRLTIQEMGIPGMVLMENAARGAVRVFLEHFRPSPGARITILCGKGNNGGDGYVMARYLHNRGLNVIVIVLGESDRISGDAHTNLEIIKNINLEIIEAVNIERWASVSKLLDDSDYIIDGILGTGLDSDVRDYYGQVLNDINESGKAVMAIDIPSGINADNGQIMGTALKADLTVTFGFPKTGQLTYPGAELTGRLIRIDIGIPNIIADRIATTCSLIEPDYFDYLLGDEKMDIHKGTRGHLFILAGSEGKTGAATLAALGALRAGAGLVTVGIPESLNHILEGKLTEAMTVPLPETDKGSLSGDAANEIFRLLEGKTALALGPGLSTHPETMELVRNIVKRCSIPFVIDADGLNAMAGNVSVMSCLNKNMILTPHPGEMARLAGLDAKEIQKNRISVSKKFVAEQGCFLVLKGARTIITEPDGMTYVNPTGNPALASGGSGDVLTGLIAGYLTRGWPTVKAVMAGVFLHGLAADYLAEELGEGGVLAGELSGVVPLLMKSLAEKEWPLESPSPLMDLHYPI